MGIFDKAKEATSSASAKAAEVRRDVAAKAEEMKDHASAKAAALKESAATMGSDFMEAAASKVKDTLHDFNEALPIVREAGYVLDGVSVELGIPPKIYANFATTHHLAEDKVKEILETHADNKLAVGLVKSLFHAQRLQSNIKFAGLAARGITVELGLIPTLVIKFGIPMTASSAPAVQRPTQEQAHEAHEARERLLQEGAE